MKINEVCKKTNITKRNIHFYIKEGLVSPVTDEHNGYYNFSNEDCSHLIFIRDMRNAGVPLSVIKSIFVNPYTASYYISSHMRDLKNEQRHIEQTLVSLKYILDNMPLYPDLLTVSRLAQDAAIPAKSFDISNDGYFDPYVIAAINQFLWGSFIRDELNEYQEFLWEKVNRLSTGNPSPEYIKLGQTLYSTNTELISQLFSYNIKHYSIIEDLTDDQILVYANEKIEELKQIIHNPHYIKAWVENYESFFRPLVILQVSDLSVLVQKLSPYYERYVRNINQISNIIFSYIKSEEGKDILYDIETMLGEHIDIEHANHGEIEALLELPNMYSLFEKN